MSQGSYFDGYVDSYDDALNHALEITGAGKAYYCQERMHWLARDLKTLGAHPRQGMDFGCGNGSSTPLLRSVLNLSEVIGVDVAPMTITKAQQLHGTKEVQFATVSERQYSEEFDVVYCNGVFHHIDKPERPTVLNYIYRSLRPGGIFSLWENNPWSPAARYVMSRCAFDKDAQMLTPHATVRLLRAAGFEILSTAFLFIFPEFLKICRPLENVLHKLPMGAQYQVLARK